MNWETIHDSLVEENIVTNIEYVVYFATVENNKCIPLIHNISKYAESDHIISFFKVSQYSLSPIIAQGTPFVCSQIY